MASGQALGTALTYNPLLTGDANAKLFALQRQAALAQALQTEGMTPLSTNDRQIGGVGYRISPFEGLNKIAEALTGAIGQSKAASDYADIYNPKPTADQTQAGQQTAMNVGAANGQPGPTNAASGAAPQYAQGTTATNPAMSPLAAGVQAGDPAAVKQYATYLLMNPDTARAGAELLGKFAGPTDVQKNLGMENMPQYVKTQLYPGYNKMQETIGSAAGGAAPYGAVPDLGPTTQVQPTAPIQSVTQTPDAAQQYRQENGMANPPIVAQRQSMGLPTGSNIPMGNPQVSASQLNAPQSPTAIPAPPSGIQLGAPSPQASALPNFAGMTNDQAAIAKKSLESGATAKATELGTDLADATKTYNVAASNLPRAFQRFQELRNASKNASYGGGVSDQPEGQGLLDHFLPSPNYARDYAKTYLGAAFEPGRATANQKIEQAAKQGILSELGPQLQGMKPNRLLDSLAVGASGLDPADPDPARQSAINGLQDQYVSNIKSLAAQRQQYGDRSVPTEIDLASLISQNADPTYEVHIIHPDGTLGTVKARSLLQAVSAGSKIQ